MSESTVPLVSASGFSKESVYSFAENVADQLGYRPNGDLTKIVGKLGGAIEVKSFWDAESTDNDSGSAEFRNENDFTIFISDSTTVERDRFTIAHELGHYVLHYLWPIRNGETPSPKRALRYGSDRAEWEANWFAAAFLMPKEDFLEAAKASKVSSKYDFQALAGHFGVSASAAKVRAKALGLAR